MSEFKEGDYVHHKADLKTVWIIDKLREETAICSTSKSGVTKIEEMARISLIAVIKQKPSNSSNWAGGFI